MTPQEQVYRALEALRSNVATQLSDNRYLVRRLDALDDPVEASTLARVAEAWGFWVAGAQGLIRALDLTLMDLYGEVHE